VGDSANAPTQHHVQAGEAEKTKDGLRWRVLHGHNVDFHFEACGIRMVPTEAGVEAAKGLVDDGETTETNRMLEDWTGNGWLVIPAEAIGALTGCTDILTQDFTVNDAGGWEPVVPKPSVFAHMNYQIELPIESWAEGKPVFFDRGEVEAKEVRCG